MTSLCVWCLCAFLAVATIGVSSDTDNCSDFDIIPQSIIVEAGSTTACLSCDYPNLTSEKWKKGSTFINSDDTDQCNCRLLSELNQLCFNDFNGDVDAGEYSCFVNIMIGVPRTCTVNVTAAVPPEIEPPIPPAKESVTLDVGAPLLLSASLSNPGIPRGNISFVKNGVALGGGVDPRITVTPSGVDSVDLRITELVPADQGVYTIHAINDLGLMDEQTRSVFVRYAPLVTLTPSTVNPSTNKVTLTCEAEAFPNFSVTGGSNQATWLKNDFSVPVEERIEESESVFSNNPFKQTLVNEITVDCELNVLYKCSVMNAQGTSTDTAAVCGGVGPMEAVLGVQVERTSDGGGAKITWIPSSESVTGYRITIFTANAGGTFMQHDMVIVPGKDVTELNYDKLECVPNELKTYKFTVESMSANSAFGPPSSTVILTCQSPPDPPENRLSVTLVSAQSDSITVIWEVKQSYFNDLVSLLLRLRETNSNTFVAVHNYTLNRDLAASGQPISSCLAQLKPSTKYDLCLLANFSDKPGALELACGGIIETLRDDGTSFTPAACVSPSSTVLLPVPSSSPGLPYWAIAVIVVGALAIVAFVFCFIGIGFACQTSRRKDIDFGSTSSITTNGLSNPVQDKRATSPPSRSCLSYHRGGHSTNWSEHMDTLRQLETRGGTSV